MKGKTYKTVQLMENCVRRPLGRNLGVIEKTPSLGH